MIKTTITTLTLTIITAILSFADTKKSSYDAPKPTPRDLYSPYNLNTFYPTSKEEDSKSYYEKYIKKFVDIATSHTQRTLSEEVATLQELNRLNNGEFFDLENSKQDVIYKEHVISSLKEKIAKLKLNKLTLSGNTEKYKTHIWSGLNFPVNYIPYLNNFAQTSKILQKATAIAQSSATIPNAINSYFYDKYELYQHLNTIEGKFEDDKEISQIIVYLKNKQFLVSSFVSLLTQFPSLVFSLADFSNLLGMPIDYFNNLNLLQKSLRNGLIINTANTVYQKLYSQYYNKNSNYWSHILEQTDPSFSGEKSNDYLKLEIETQKEFTDMSSEELKLHIRKISVLKLLESNKDLIANFLFIRLKNEGKDGIVAEFLRELMISENTLNHINTLNESIYEDYKLAIDFFVEYLNL